MPDNDEKLLIEARDLLRIQGGLKAALDMLMVQFNVLQMRAQSLLALATLALTITGFSGPKIASAGAFSRNALALGLTLVLLSVVLVLTVGLRIRWVTQFRAADDERLLVSILRYRDAKTRGLGRQLVLLVAGLSFYVAGVVVYFLVGAP